MRVAILSPIAWRTPPTKYGPWEQVASTITEGLVEKGHDVTLFASGNSVTSARLKSVSMLPYECDPSADPKVLECLHISNLMENAEDFDIIHNHFDFLPLTYSRLIKTPMITTIHGFSSPKIIPVYKKYNSSVAYISISDSDRHRELTVLDTIYHGVDPSLFSFRERKEDYLLYFGRIHPEKGLHTAIEIALKTNRTLKIAGLIQDRNYFKREIEPKIDGRNIQYLGNLGKVDGDLVMGAAKALLHPITFEEPFGLSVLECMMCGTPVIAYTRGSMKELIVDGVTGFLVKNSDEAVVAVQKLHQLDPFVCRVHAEENFGVEKMINSYINAYQRVSDNFHNLIQ